MNKKILISLGVLSALTVGAFFVPVVHAMTYTDSQITETSVGGALCGNDTAGSPGVSGTVSAFGSPSGAFYTTPDLYCTDTSQKWIENGQDETDTGHIRVYAHPYIASANGSTGYVGGSIISDNTTNTSYAVITSATLTTSPSSIVKGNSSVLSWSSTSVTSAALTCTGSGFSTGGATSGSVTVSPTSTTNYSVTCSGPDQTATANATLTVTPPATLSASCSASPSTINNGQSSTWTAAVSGGIAPYTYSWSGTNGLSGSNTSETVTYPSAGTNTGSLTVSDSGVSTGHQSTTVNCSNNVTVVQTSPDLVPNSVPPTVNITLGQSATVNGVVLNQGNGSTGSAFNDMFVTDLNSAGTAWNAIQTASPMSANLAPNGTSSFSTTFPASDFPTPGSYYYAYCVNYNSGWAQSANFTESNNSNNCSAIGTIIVASTYPNIQASTGSAATATINVPVTLAGTVTNTTTNGGAGPAGTFPSVIQVCDANCATINQVIPTNNTSSLALGASAPVSASYTPSTMTQLFYQVCGDETTSWTNALNETDTADNCGGFQPLTVSYPPIGGSCSASPATVKAGDSVTWTASPTGGAGAGTYTYQWSGNVSGNNPSETQPYPSAGSYTGSVLVSSGGQSTTLQCSPGSVSNPVTVISCVPTFTANPSTIAQGANSTLSWSVSSLCSSSCTGTGFSTGGAISGASTVKPGTIPTTSYALTCSSQAPVNTTISVTVPSVHITATPTRVSAPSAANAVTLTWNSTNNTSPNTCSITRGGVTVPGSATTLSGTAVDPNPITAQTLYTATCTTGTPGDPGTSVTGTAIVNVVPSFNEF